MQKSKIQILATDRRHGFARIRICTAETQSTQRTKITDNIIVIERENRERTESINAGL